MSSRPALSLPQLLVLRTAAERSDRMVLPLPSNLRARGANQARLLAALLKAGLVEELPTSDAALSWRTDEGRGFAMRVTDAGLAAIGSPAPGPATETEEPAADAAAEVTPAVPDETVAPTTPGTEPQVDAAAPPPPASNPQPAATPPIPSGKLGMVLTAVTATPGATLSELVTLTGWQPHTTRAAITGLRQRGFPVHLAEVDGRKAYRLTPAG